MGTLFSTIRSQLPELPLVTTAPPKIIRSPGFNVIFRAMQIHLMNCVFSDCLSEGKETAIVA
jgi:hypothetical protein